MKAFLLTGFCAMVIGITSLRAQSPDTALIILHFSLSHVSDTTQPENPLKMDYDLCLGKRVSVYKRNFKTNPNSSLTNIAVSGNIVTSGGIASNTTPRANPFEGLGNYYKDMQEGKMYYINAAGGKLFAIEDNTPDIDWIIGEETKLILGLTCQKATGRFKGRNYEVWFCSQLPYSNGPWKLGGLPGLILEAYDTKKEVVFTLASIDNTPNAKMDINVPKTAVLTTPVAFKQYEEALKRDRDANIGSVSGTLSGGTFKGALSSTGSLNNGQPVKPRMFNNPIEKED